MTTAQKNTSPAVQKLFTAGSGRSLTYCITMLLLVLITSCKKDTAATDTVINREDTITSATMFYKLHRVENFLGDTSDADPTATRPTLFYSLEAKTPRTNAYQKTSSWDLAFGGLYNSFISANNGANTANHGYGSNGAGGILILEEKFELVTNIPSDDQFKTGKELFGTDKDGAFGVGTGWYLYDFEGTIRGDGSYDKMHVAYALSDTRTLVVRTGKGNYAKVKMISCYKDAFTSDKWFRQTPHMYFTFEYILVPKGSTKFETKP